jgi:hypothetical protein
VNRNQLRKEDELDVQVLEFLKTCKFHPTFGYSMLKPDSVSRESEKLLGILNRTNK